MTIRGRILVAFLVMSVITAGLGAYATMGVRNAGLLVDKTFAGLVGPIGDACDLQAVVYLGDGPAPEGTVAAPLP